jgi:hypothetical protein
MTRAPLVLVFGLALFSGGLPAAIAKEAPPPVPPVMVTGVGYAPISSQPATTDEERRLLAIRASQLAAMRNLAEQIYGLRLESTSRAAGSTLQSDQIRAVVSGTVAGARIVKITPKGDDTYETVVEAERPATSVRK